MPRRRTNTPPARSALIRLGGLAALLALGSFIAYRMGWFDYTHTLEHIDSLRQSHSLAAFMCGFILVYGLGTAIGLPGLPFTVAAGVLFGTLLGTAISWAGAMVGATLGYWIARRIARDQVLRWLKRFKHVDAAVEQARDFAGMFRLRLIPVLPLGTINFVGGLARANFGAFLLATALGIIPSLAIYAYFADSLLEGVGSGRKDALTSLFVASTLLLLLSLAPKIVARRQRRML
jgi:uncharacterized membrane protein YdjX (TVP38/TMEM64 family)